MNCGRFGREKKSVTCIRSGGPADPNPPVTAPADKEEGSSLLALLTDKLLALDGSVKEEGVNF